MKKFFVLYIEALLSEFRGHREKKKGEWYLIRDQDMNGMATTEYWSQDKPNEDEAVILKTKIYK